MSMRTGKRHSRDGVTIVIIVLLMVVLVGMVAFAVDVGRMYLVRSQLQTAVDAGALAASLKLKSDPTALDEAAAAALQFVQLNRVGWNVEVPDQAIVAETGTWDADTRTFSLAGASPNAVRVSALQDDEPIMFGRVFGNTTFGVPRSAIATGGGESLDIMMVLDLSGSMLYSGRIEALRSAAPVFVDVIDQNGSNDKIGVMVYGADPDTTGVLSTYYMGAPANLYPSGSNWVGAMESDLASDFPALKSGALSTANLQPGKYGNYTPTGAAIRDATHDLLNSANARSDAKKIIVLMSDGMANRPDGDGPGYALQMAAYANSNKVKIYTISLGNGADVAFMQSIATATGGEHFYAAGSGVGALTAALTTAFENVANAVKRTQLVQ